MASPLDKLKAAFVSALHVPADGDFEPLAYAKTKGWDSVAHMSLIAAIESEFDVMLDTDDVIGLSSFGKAKEILTKQGVSFA